MMRIKDEACLLRRSLERTFQVCQTVVIWDDGSEDESRNEAFAAAGNVGLRFSEVSGVVSASLPDDKAHLYWIHSPYRPALRPIMAASEIRDRGALWEFVKARLAPRYVLCLDGDEMLSQAALREWEATIARLDAGIDIIHFPVVYLWDREDRRRVDGIYGPREGLATLNYPRLFTLQRVSERQQFNMRFSWHGTTAGIHCGSIPREGFLIDKLGDPFLVLPPSEPVAAAVAEPIVHYGYVLEEDRQRKYKYYTSVDPGNVAEGEYKHIVGLPNVHASGPLELVPWDDA